MIHAYRFTKDNFLSITCDGKEVFSNGPWEHEEVAAKCGQDICDKYNSLETNPKGKVFPASLIEKEITETSVEE